MLFSSVLSLSLVALAAASPLESRAAKVKPVAFFLAGDSTTATQSSNGGGWGDGFLKTLVKGAIGTNYGHNGATTVSFVAGGDWKRVLDAVRANRKEYRPYVTIQFGHNDQKVDKNITNAQFEANLSKFVEDVQCAGGTPILVTPLPRRGFSTSTGLISLNLPIQVASTLAVASRTGAAVIDLNKASMAYLNAIGQVDAWKYNLNPDDRTHLNAEGSVVFGNLVGSLLGESKVGKQVKEFIKLNTTIVDSIAKGVFVWPA